MTDNDLPERIRFFRRKQNLSSRGLAKLLGVSHSTVSNWETGRAAPRMSRLIEMTTVFKVSLPGFFRARLPEESAEVEAEA